VGAAGSSVAAVRCAATRGHQSRSSNVTLVVLHDLRLDAARDLHDPGDELLFSCSALA
jgi:hypothetical protein